MDDYTGWWINGTGAGEDGLAWWRGFGNDLSYWIGEGGGYGDGAQEMNGGGHGEDLAQGHTSDFGFLRYREG